MPEKKKVLIFCGGTRVFGAEIVTLSIAKELKLSGYKIFCITSAWNDGNFHKRLEEAEIQYQPVRLGFFYLTRFLWTLDTLVHLPGAISVIKRIIKKFKPDIIYHTSHTSLLMAYPALQKSRNLLFVFDPYYGKLNRIYFKILNKFVHTYVAVSNAIKLNLIETGASPEKIIVIKNGINIQSFMPPRNLKDIVYFGIIGQIIPRKGHNDVIGALKILKSENLSFKCVIIGAGNNGFIDSLNETIKQYKLENDVVWIDFIEARDEIYQLLDVVLVPSTTLDPLPTVAMEAGLYYKPAIVTQVGGLPEIIADGITGFVVSPESPLELAQKMKIFITETSLIKTMGTAAHDHIVKNFDVKLQAKLLHSIIDN